LGGRPDHPHGINASHPVSRPIPPSRSRSKSSIESASATIPATTAGVLIAAFGFGTVNKAPAVCNPRRDGTERLGASGLGLVVQGHLASHFNGGMDHGFVSAVGQRRVPVVRPAPQRRPAYAPTSTSARYCRGTSSTSRSTSSCYIDSALASVVQSGAESRSLD
jgi:hypothetical protein